MVERLVPRSDLGEPAVGRDWFWLIYALAALILIAGGAGLIYAIWQEEQRYAPVYERLGIERLPKNIENMPYIQADLVKLLDGPCDRQNAHSLAESLTNLGQNVLAEQVEGGYQKNCARVVDVAGYDATLAQLATGATSADIRRLARQLRSSRCDYAATKQLIAKLQDDNRHQPVTQIGDGFLNQCQRNAMVGYWTMLSYYQLGDYSRSLALTQEFEQIEPKDPYWQYWKGRNFSQLGQLRAAADAHVLSLSLWDKPENVVLNDYWQTSQALRAVQRYCDAMKPLQQYAGYDPVKRLTPQIQKELTSLAELGSCPG